MKRGDYTPWGAAETVKEIAPGIWFVTTSSHGGVKLSPERNQIVPENMRTGSFNGQGSQGWYEEDCDWTIPYLLYIQEFDLAAERMGPAPSQAAVMRILDAIHPGWGGKLVALAEMRKDSSIPAR